MKTIAFIFLGLLAVCLQLNAQNTGVINRPATIAAGRLVLDPNSDGYTSTNSSGFGSSDVTNSEITFTSVPSFSIEPYGDLRRGPDHLFSDFVPDANGNGVYMTYTGSNLLFRFRVGSVMPGSKGYSIMIDTDNKFGATGPNADPNYIAATTGTNGNPGFEIEVVLETNSRIAIYNADGTSTPTLIKSYTNWQDMSQVSVAGTFDNGDPDFFIDFYIPFADLQAAPFNLTTSSSLRFCATTVMSSQSAIGGPKSDIYGLSDDNYPNTNDQYEAYVKAQPQITIGTLSTGFGTICTEAPAVNTPINSGSVSITGTWTMSALTGAKNTSTITVYKNGSTVLGTVTGVASGTTWTLPPVTLVNGDIITAKAQASTESMCLLSNAVTVSTCNASNKPATPLLSCYATTKGITGTNLSTGWTVHTDNVTRSTADDNITNSSGLFAAPTGTSPNLNWTYSSGCSGGSPLISGSYKVYYTNNITGCASEPAYVCVAGNGGSALAGTVATPVITTPANGNLTTATTAISGTATTGSTLYLYVDGIVTKTTTAAAGAFSFSNVSFSLGQAVYIISEYNTGTVTTSYCEAQTAKVTVGCYTTPPVINADNNNQLTAGAAITGTSGEAAGTIIRVYTSANTLVATTPVQANGSWSTGNASTTPATYVAVAATIYYATAQKGICGLSPQSGSVTAATATSNARCGTITGPVTAGLTSVSGTLTGAVANTVVRLYEDGVNIGSVTTSTTGWTITVASTALYPNGVLTIGVQEPSAQETACTATATVNCAAPPTAPVINPNSFSVPANQSVTYNITNAVSGYFYGIADANTGMSLATGVWAASNGNLSITTIPFAASGNYSVSVKATTLSGLNVCSSGPAASSVMVNATLPVRFITVNATPVASRVTVRWIVAAEQNVAYYEVESSADCNRFTTAGRVNYSAYTAGVYSLADVTLTARRECYRVKQVDLDGTAHYSNIVTVTQQNSAASMQVMPNPVQTSTTLLLQLPKEGNAQISVIDMTGKTILQQKAFVRAGLNTVVLSSLNKLSAGIYRVNVITGDQHLSGNMIKE